MRLNIPDFYLDNIKKSNIRELRTRLHTLENKTKELEDKTKKPCIECNMMCLELIEDKYCNEKCKDFQELRQEKDNIHIQKSKYFLSLGDSKIIIRHFLGLYNIRSLCKRCEFTFDSESIVPFCYQCLVPLVDHIKNLEEDLEHSKAFRSFIGGVFMFILMVCFAVAIYKTGYKV